MKPDPIQLKKRTNLFVEDTFDRKGHVIPMQAQLARLMEENRILRKTETERMAADSQEMSAWRLIHVSPSPATPLVPCGIIPTLSQAHCRSHNRAVRASHAVCIHYASSRAYALFQESYVPGLEKAGATLQTKAGQVHLLPPSISMPSLGETSYWEGRSQSKSVGMPNRIALFHREIFSLPRTVTTPKIPDRCWLLSRRRSL